jgi:hypothetical protein
MAGVRRTFEHRWAEAGAQTDPGDAKVDLGWIAEKPPYQQENWRAARVDDMLAHIEDHGIPEWNAATVYTEGALVIAPFNRKAYRAVVANTGNAPHTDLGSNWLLLVPIADGAQQGLVELASFSEVNSGTPGILAVTPAGLHQRAATDVLSGLVELATGAETQALSDSTRAVTPAGLASAVASDIQRGLVELATAAEVLAGTDATRAVSPAALGALGSSKTANGYQILPGGLIIQWGQTGLISDTLAHDVTLPIAYPTAHLWAGASGRVNSIDTNQGPSGARPHPSTPLTTIRISTDNNNQLVDWLSIGH